jgi:hypothetical protein
MMPVSMRVDLRLFRLFHDCEVIARVGKGNMERCNYPDHKTQTHAKHVCERRSHYTAL